MKLEVVQMRPATENWFYEGMEVLFSPLIARSEHDDNRVRGAISQVCKGQCKKWENYLHFATKKSDVRRQQTLGSMKECLRTIDPLDPAVAIELISETVDCGEVTEQRYEQALKGLFNPPNVRRRITRARNFFLKTGKWPLKDEFLCEKRWETFSRALVDYLVFLESIIEWGEAILSKLSDAPGNVGGRTESLIKDCKRQRKQCASKDNSKPDRILCEEAGFLQKKAWLYFGEDGPQLPDLPYDLDY